MRRVREPADVKAPHLLAGCKRDRAGGESGLNGDNPHAGIDVLALAESDVPLIGTADDGGKNRAGGVFEMRKERGPSALGGLRQLPQCFHFFERGAVRRFALRTKALLDEAEAA